MPWSRALMLALPLLGIAVAIPAAPTPPASFVSYDDTPAPEKPRPPANPIYDRLALDAGFFWGNVHTAGQFNNAQGISGTPLTAEQNLGLTNEAYQPWVELMVRLEDRSKLRVDWFDLRRSGEVQLPSTLLFGDQTFQGGQALRSTINWRQMDITYTYSFLRTERFELGAGLGLHLLEAEARAQVPGTPQLSDYSEAGPFATLALDGTWAFARRWSLNARGQYMHLSVSNFTGELEDYRADVQYRWRRNFAIGAAYEYTLREVDVTNHDPSGFVRLRVSGPQLFLRVSY
ncbi:MAG: hypothetical protein WB646_11430 [Steroidobacteraceae bacterium]